MSAEPAVSQREFDQYVKATDRELERLDREQRDHQEGHVLEATATQHRREWTWQRVLGILTALGVLVGLELQYVHR